MIRRAFQRCQVLKRCGRIAHNFFYAPSMNQVLSLQHENSWCQTRLSVSKKVAPSTELSFASAQSVFVSRLPIPNPRHFP